MPTALFNNLKTTNQPTNQPTKDLTEGGDLRFVRHPSICIVIPTLTAPLGSVTATWNYNRAYAYAKYFRPRVRTSTRAY
jgi:hypothetical protein